MAPGVNLFSSTGKLAYTEMVDRFQIDISILALRYMQLDGLVSGVRFQVSAQPLAAGAASLIEKEATSWRSLLRATGNDVAET